VTDGAADLDDLRWHWDDAHLIHHLGPGTWVAQRRDSRQTLGAEDPETLRERIKADYAARPISRQAGSRAGPPADAKLPVPARGLTVDTRLATSEGAAPIPYRRQPSQVPGSAPYQPCCPGSAMTAGPVCTPGVSLSPRCFVRPCCFAVLPVCRLGAHA
jgi:hypothetical protein